MTVRIITADVMDGLRQLEDESVHCVVTSPPYWGLRDYGVGGQLGLEPTPEAFVAKMVEAFREVRRVLRRDGTLWLNMGDTYASSPPGCQNGGVSERSTLHGVRGVSGTYRETLRQSVGQKRNTVIGGIKPKDLMGMPWRVAFALQADGWWLRGDYIWNKPNPMPESVRDRCTKSHEYVFHLSKSERYYFDAEAIKESAGDDPGPGVRGWAAGPDHSTAAHNRPGMLSHADLNKSRIGAKGNANTFRGGSNVNGEPGPRTVSGNSQRVRDNRGGALSPGSRSPHSLSAFEAKNEGEYASRNKRSVWTIATAPYPEAHFATFPPALCEIPIKAGTSEHGCCAKCGAPWVRNTETRYDNPGNRTTNGPRSLEQRHETAGFPVRLEKRVATLGWGPSCPCGPEVGVVPAVVLDPFVGAGTTCMVADRLGRDAIGIELNPDYAAMAEKRIARDRLERGQGTMADVAKAQLPPTPLEALMQEGA